ncbi:MAG: hypothetical protein R3F55_02155 [Alphaproteobacteria bacterium]
MKRIAVVALLPLLSGCGIPPAVTIASYALDGVVLAASGKTVRDHALSTVAEQDCSMFHVVSGDPICMDYQPTARAAAALASETGQERALLTTSDGRIIRVAAEARTQLATAAAAEVPAADAADADAPVALHWQAPELTGTF